MRLLDFSSEEWGCQSTYTIVEKSEKIEGQQLI